VSRHEPPDSRELARIAELLRDAPQPPTQSELERGLGAVRRRLSAGKTQRGSRGRRLWAGALAVVCLLVVVTTTFWLRRSSSPVSPKPVAVQRIEGGQLLQGGYLSESGPHGIRLFFDEGSQCALTPGGRGRLRFDANAGVRLLLERGAASLQITPTPEPRWSIESGPFLVTVKGTDFTVGWDPTSEQFELTLRRGRVVVSGPLIGEAFVVRPGQMLSVSLPKAETVITEVRAGAPVVSPAPSVTPAAGSPIPAPPPPNAVLRNGAVEAPAPASSTPMARQWRAALANGEWDRIVAEAERAGIEASLEAASSDDLFALADAARYRRRLELAEAALRAQRRRFPSSPRAAEAVFLLGRVAELRPAGRAVARQRYDEYLTRAPSGTYAAEALGRKMTLVNEAEGAAKARPIADEYLRRFPGGSYAGAARTLLSVGE
jgi:TolA-binding protein